jgi:hypothetical protein
MLREFSGLNNLRAAAPRRSLSILLKTRVITGI